MASTRNYPLPAQPRYQVVEKNIAYNFKTQKYGVWKSKRGERIIIDNLNTLEDARRIKNILTQYFNIKYN